MMKNIIKKIHSTPYMGVVIVTGGGTNIFSLLMSGGGASKSILSGFIPYSYQSSYDMVGKNPGKLISERGVRMLAMSAYQKSIKEGISDTFGVASSNILQSIPTEREGRSHYFYAALQTASKTVSLTLCINDVKHIFLDKTPEKIREIEEDISTKMILNLISEGNKIKDRVVLGYDLDRSVVRRESTIEIDFFDSMLLGESFKTGFNFNNGNYDKIEIFDFTTASRVIFSGSFNPMHEGHYEMGKIISKKYNVRVDFELSINNIDKSNLDLISIEERLESMLGQGILWVTNTPTFMEKAKIFHEPSFVVGIDTMKRICDNKYGYSSDVAANFFANGVKFLVFPREVNGIVEEDISDLPIEMQNKMELVESKRHFIGESSTEVRGKS